MFGSRLDAFQQENSLKHRQINSGHIYQPICIDECTLILWFKSLFWAFILKIQVSGISRNLGLKIPPVVPPLKENQYLSIFA